jgi:geranylgeranyl pyrophosphate synthase
LLFQFADDIIDIKGSKKIAGKSIKKDKKKGKSTLVALIGYEKANSYASKLKQNILKKLSKYGKKADNLINIVEFILERNF